MGAKLEESRGNLGRAAEQQGQLEGELVCLKGAVSALEEAQVRAAEELEARRLKEEEMDGQLKTMERVLEEELEQFETLIQAKDSEVIKLDLQSILAVCSVLQIP